MGFREATSGTAVPLVGQRNNDDHEVTVTQDENTNKSNNNNGEINNSSDNTDRKETLARKLDVDESSPRPKKRVRFENSGASATENANDSHAVSVQIVPSEIYHEDLDKDNLWWTADESNVIYNDAKESARKYRKQHIGKVRQLLYILAKSSSESGKTSFTRHDETAIVKENNVDIETSARGMESTIVPILKRLRRSHVQTVLDAQCQIRRNLSADMKARVLCLRSYKSSRPSRIMAQLLAASDRDDEKTV